MQVTAASKEKPGACLACGGSPVAHTPTYISHTLEAWCADRLSRIFSRRPLSSMQKGAERLFERFAEALMRALTGAGIFRTLHDPEKALSYRSQVIWEEANRRGIEMEQLAFMGFPTELFRARIHGRWIYFQSLPVSAEMRRDIFPGIDDKLLFKNHLQSRGIPISRAVCVTRAEDALAVFEEMHKPLVVKPRIGSRARHTMTNIWTREELRDAFDSAQELCHYVLIEEHLEGAVSRATVVDGRLRGFLQAYPAQVIGDGMHTIAELIEIKNASRPESVSAVTLDREHHAYLSRSGLTPDSRVDAGRVVTLSRRTGRFEGGTTREMSREIHPALRTYVEAAAQALRVPVVGFDVIIPDPEIDPGGQRWGILEANSLPYIDLHYFPLYGEPSNVASFVWDLWEKPIQ